MTGLALVDRAPADRLGKVRRLEDAQGRYIEIAKNTFPKGMRLDGLKLVVDCANGAAYRVAPRVLFELGAEVIEITRLRTGPISMPDVERQLLTPCAAR